jgi:hypothetical protein
MTYTRAQRRQALDHIINVIWCDDGSDKNSILQGFITYNNWNDPEDLLSIEYDDFDHIERIFYAGNQQHVEKIPKMASNALKLFKWYVELDHNCQYEELKDFTSIDEESWDLFKKDVRNKVIVPSFSTSLSPHVTPSAKPSAKSSSPVEDFQKTIKRDMSAFRKLKDKKQWNSCQRATKATARAQDVYDVLDPNYKPNTADEKALFKRKKLYMYAAT